MKNLIKRLLKKFAKPPAPIKGSLGSLPNWQLVTQHSKHWQNLLKSQQGPMILIPTSVGGLSAATILESTLGVALTLRGAQVRFLLCDGILPACLQVHQGKIKSTDVIADYKLAITMCTGCVQRGKTVYESTGLPISYYSEFITPDELAKIREYSSSIAFADIKNEHALAGALRFFASGELPNTKEAEVILRRYFEAALITEAVIQAAFKKYSVEAAVFHHGIYVPQGIIGEVARANNVRVVNWQVAYRKKSFIFSHHETYHHTLMNEPVAVWQDIPWSNALDKATIDYLQSRTKGSNDWIWFHDQPQHDIELIRQETGMDFTKPIVTLLTNVFWDAQLHFKANAFKNMLDWLLRSIEYFKNRPELQLAIRIHPAEVRGAIPSRQPIVEEIKKAYPVLPANIFIIAPESQVSTYALAERSNAVIIYGTKTGVELSAVGIPVIVAGEAWVRNKGFTFDANSPENYFSLLDRLPFEQRLDAENTLRARKYAFHFFFRRFVPIQFMQPSSAQVPYEVCIQGLEELLPGKDKGLDVICDGILQGTDFIYPAEEVIQ